MSERDEMKAQCIGEFEFAITAECGECIDVGPDDDCEVCQGGIVYERMITVPWDTCKKIYKAMAKFDPSRKAQTKPPANKVPDNIAKQVADDLFLLGCERNSPTYRIQFMGGSLHHEKGQGGLNKPAFEKWLTSKLTKLLSAQPDAGAGQWIPCSERLPNEADQDFHSCVWVCFIDGEIELHEAQEVIDTWDDDFAITHWMPTGLRRPQPPQTQEEE